jgi:hypothetical protein
MASPGLRTGRGVIATSAVRRRQGHRRSAGTLDGEGRRPCGSGPEVGRGRMGNPRAAEVPGAGSGCQPEMN